MNILQPTAVIGTNAWGGSLYGKLVRGSYVPDEVLMDAMSMAQKKDIPLYDLARDYGLGKAQKMIGEFGTHDIYLSSKYTPFTHYKKGCVIKSLEKDLKDFKRDYVDIYWLHLPTDIEDHLKEIITLYQEGKIRHVGVSNFTLEECQRSQQILAEAGIPLYGVQNHYSLICRDWEKNGLLSWCKDNGVSFWAWAVLEEGMLTDPRHVKKKSPMQKAFHKQNDRIAPLLNVMIPIADELGISVAQLAMAYVSQKGIVPMCGCRKPNQVAQLAEATTIVLSPEQVAKLEETADQCNAKIMGKDLFRPFVLKEKKKK